MATQTRAHARGQIQSNTKGRMGNHGGRPLMISYLLPAMLLLYSTPLRVSHLFLPCLWTIFRHGDGRGAWWYWSSAVNSNFLRVSSGGIILWHQIPTPVGYVGRCPTSVICPNSGGITCYPGGYSLLSGQFPGRESGSLYRVCRVYKRVISNPDILIRWQDDPELAVMPPFEGALDWCRIHCQ